MKQWLHEIILYLYSWRLEVQYAFIMQTYIALSVNLHHMYASYINSLLKEPDPNIFYYVSFPNSEVPSFLLSAFSPRTDLAHGAWKLTVVCYQNIVQISGCNHSSWTYNTHQLSTDDKSKLKHKKMSTLCWDGRFSDTGKPLLDVLSISVFSSGS